jgi:hypothetical protein
MRIAHVDLDEIQLDSTGLLRLVPGEQQVCSLDDAELDHQQVSVGPKGKDIRGVRGRLQATTRRLVWFDKHIRNTDVQRSCACSLAAIYRTEMSSGAPSPHGPLATVVVGLPHALLPI